MPNLVWLWCTHTNHAANGFVAFKELDPVFKSVPGSIGVIGIARAQRIYIQTHGRFLFWLTDHGIT